jgi:hypothetical protein
MFAEPLALRLVELVVCGEGEGEHEVVSSAEKSPIRVAVNIEGQSEERCVATAVLKIT